MFFFFNFQSKDMLTFSNTNPYFVDIPAPYRRGRLKKRNLISSIKKRFTGEFLYKMSQISPMHPWRTKMSPLIQLKSSVLQTSELIQQIVKILDIAVYSSMSFIASLRQENFPTWIFYFGGTLNFHNPHRASGPFHPDTFWISSFFWVSSWNVLDIFGSLHQCGIILTRHPVPFIRSRPQRESAGINFQH